MHAGVGVEQGQLVRVELMLNDERSSGDAPQPASAVEVGNGAGLDRGEPQQGCGGVELVGFLAVDDAGGAVSQEALGEGAAL